MNRYGIEITVKNAPKLDPEFMPILQFNRAFLKTAKKPKRRPFRKVEHHFPSQRTQSIPAGNTLCGTRSHCRRSHFQCSDTRRPC